MEVVEGCFCLEMVLLVCVDVDVVCGGVSSIRSLLLFVFYVDLVLGPFFLVRLLSVSSNLATGDNVAT